MTRIILLSVFVLSGFISISAQGVKGLFDKVSTAVSPTTGNLSNDDIISGLKEALRVGTDSSSKKLSKLGGVVGDAAVNVLMPKETKKVERTLRNLGKGSMVDKAVLSMNRAAEDAASGVGTATPSRPPRPRVVVAPSGVAPMKPVTTGTMPRSSRGQRTLWIQFFVAAMSGWAA